MTPSTRQRLQDSLQSQRISLFFSCSRVPMGLISAVRAQGPKTQWLSSDPTGSASFLHPGTRERMSAGYRPLEDKDQPSKSLPPSSLGACRVGVATEQ
ncbi:UNVERIFIED_CONTAM: hypothetical protein FKN15_001137 [Acipenser sinensis]